MKIIIADDDSLIRISLKTIIESSGEIEVIFDAENGRQLVEAYKKYSPDAVLTDIRMGDFDGIDACKEILQFDPNAKVLLLTTFSDDEYIVRALQTGVGGYILKQDYASIVPSLKAVVGGQQVFGGEIMKRTLNMVQKEKTQNETYEHDLSEQELSIIKCVAQGLNNKEIASRLYLSDGTVRNYISLILEKLNLRDRTQLAIFYFNPDFLE